VVRLVERFDPEGSEKDLKGSGDQVIHGSAGNRRKPSQVCGGFWCGNEGTGQEP